MEIENEMKASIDPGWAEALEPVMGKLSELEEILAEIEGSGGRIAPPRDDALDAFKYPLVA